MFWILCWQLSKSSELSLFDVIKIIKQKKAIKKLKNNPSELIIDGPLTLRLWKGNQRNIISGDSKFTSIAAASIIAKVKRDFLIERLESKFSGYFIFKNKGYGTKEHFSGLKEHGITDLHRKSFLTKLNLI